MNGDTKRHIDAARQVLVGVVPSPTAQIEQITNALIYKFMDDMDQAAIKAGGDPSFFTGELEPYAWTRLMDSRVGNQERMNLYSEALIKFSQAKQLPQLFREIFRSAFLPYRSPETLNLFLKEIEYFDYSHSEELGNAYEYLLSIMSSQGDAGQFRTPRHIIDFMVEVVDPTKDDTVLDPACGTAGFLISAYKHILKKHDGKDDPGNQEKPLTPDERKRLFTNFEGYDIDPGMARIAQVNMYLHQFKNPRIYQYDTLSSEERWGDKFDVILANPPFMSPKGGIKPHSKFSIQSSRSEVLFVDYIMEHLKPRGRAAVIVPEGIIFQSGKSHTQLRKSLVEDGLYAVVSLPSGVFNPYAGVKTSILFFDNQHSKQRQEILFIKVNHDGFALAAQRRPTHQNDLPQVAQIMRQWKSGEKSESNLALYVERTKVAENGDYNLSGDRYRVATDHSNAKWPMVELGDILKAKSGNGKIKGTLSTENKGTLFPAYSATGQDVFSETYDYDGQGIVVSAVGARCGKCFLANGKWSAIANTHVLVVEAQKALTKYVWFFLNDEDFWVRGGVAQPFVKIRETLTKKIPLPPLEIQEQIVAELDGYAAIIAGAKQIAANWKPKINIDPEWEKVKLGEVCETISNGVNFGRDQVGFGTKFINIKDLFVDFYIDNGTLGRVSLSDREIQRNKVNNGDMLFVRSSVKYEGVGFPALFRNDQNEDVVFCGFIIKATVDRTVLSPEFLLNLLRTDEYRSKVIFLSNKANITNISQDSIRSLEIPLPPLEIQRQIVEKIEAERQLVEAAKKLIPIYEQKSKEVIAKLWSE